MQTIRTALADAARSLSTRYDTAALDAAVLLGHVLDRPRSHLYAWGERELSTDQINRLDALVRRRASGEPTAYLTGRREFWSLDLVVSEHTLIPRPETETLVELALTCIPADGFRKVADLGTGTGAIALAIAAERPRCQILATDRTREPLEVARRNGQRHGLDNVRFAQGDWCEPLAGPLWDLIACNPPYVRMDDPHLSSGDVRFEPRAALVGGRDGLEAIRRIAAQAHRHLRPGGRLLLEHGYDQGAGVADILSKAGYTGVRTHQDLSGLDRVAEATWAG